MISLGELILYKGLYHIRINKSVYLCLACVYRLTIYLIITSIFPIYPAQAHNLRHRYIGALHHLKDQHAGRSIVHLLLLTRAPGAIGVMDSFKFYSKSQEYFSPKCFFLCLKNNFIYPFFKKQMRINTYRMNQHI